MNTIPTVTPTHFVGVDPGHKGAIALLDSTGMVARVWRMPTDTSREICLPKLLSVLKSLKRWNPSVGVEWPEAFPGSFGNVLADAMELGHQKGVFEGMLSAMSMNWTRISPLRWTKRMGVGGKTNGVRLRNEKAARIWDDLYPQHKHLIRGPRGGVLDGPLDALLIAEAMRSGVLEARFARLLTYGKSNSSRRQFPRPST